MQLEKETVCLETTLKYKTLIDELMTNSPNEEKVKKLMKGLELEYIKDPVTRLNNILQALHN